MHPAFSVIFLTTLLGVGQGLFLALYTEQLYSLINLVPVQDSERFFALGSAISLAFLVAGLVASVFHLGRPERAWRSATQWRSSWLAREVIALPLVMALVFAYGLAHWIGWNQPLFQLNQEIAVDPTLLIGLAATLATFVLFICTGMIYASLKFLQEWHSWLTVANYILLGGASGFTLATAFSAWSDAGLVGFFGTWAVILTVAALITRGASLLRNRSLRPKSTLQTAIGVRHNKIQQKSQGSMGGSFNTREFFHGRAPGFVKLVRWTFLLMVFPVPVALLGLAWYTSSSTLPLVAFAVQYLGLIAERWYFFAEARHPQNLYYQTIS